MFEEYTICPYTGLRSFTEEESLYFKGREEHIESATEQLQRNKFLMLTGASGDGKSSLVYAGIIPNARSGFLKSKYTQWCVADFRPERSPFANLCKALAQQLGIANEHTVGSELQHGFSALIDLYKNSKRFIDVDSIAWQEADDAGKAAMKREAANLIILVDQFEEFFTNPENYDRGVPSHDSNLVLNVLLETSRIALEENLPIYIVFTMRSDYIGQCAAFRGLPEYIGFSQFFVPRLNRSQLQQVIEEPAVLSGNRISRRLTERLIHDLTEGVDQLPILQHALNQIWHAANSGNEEMDLIHYAMVGGMSVRELPEEQVGRFNQWYASLPDEIKDCYHEPSLQNVLDTHTNKLYEEAVVYYKSKSAKTISDADVKTIIKASFICLTKIDQSRAVRNRMTLKEITNIIGRPEFGTLEVGTVLNIFREPGNTFIRPFITDDPASQTLQDEDILDITHESLIRNWKYLGEWAKEEFDNYTISLDFEQQLNRWVASGKSNGFLLSIGPLTYFENWFSKAKPNAHWIARYLPEEIQDDKKLGKAKQVLANAQEFLKRSATKHIVTRTVMRHGAKRIAAVLGLIALLTLSSFAVRDYFRRQNNYVLSSIREEVFRLTNSSKVNTLTLGELLSEALQDDLITVSDIVAGAQDQVAAIRASSMLVGYIAFQGKGEPQQQFFTGVAAVDSLFDSYSLENNSVESNQKVLKELAFYHHYLEVANLFSPSEQLTAFIRKNAARCATYVTHFLIQQPKGFSEMNSLHRVLEHALNHDALTDQELQQLLLILSPFENQTRSAWVLENYHRDNQMERSRLDYGFKFNGLFQELAYIYAVLGETSKALQAVDSILIHNQSYHQNDYSQMIDNASNIAGVLYTSGNAERMDAFVTGYCLRKKMDVTEFYERLLARSTPYIQIADNSDPTLTNFSNGNLQYSSNKQVGYFSDKYRDAIGKATMKPAVRDFKLALSYKNEGLLKALKNELRMESSQEPERLYDKALALYETVDPDYLKETIRIIGQGQSDFITVSNSFLFTFPDYRTQFHPFEPRSQHGFYTSTSFINYCIQKNVLTKLYATRADVASLEDWIFVYFVANQVNPQFFFRRPVQYDVATRIEAAISANDILKSADLHLLYLQLGERAFNQGNKQDFLTWKVRFNAEPAYSSMNRQFGPRVFKAYAEMVTGLIHYDMPDSADHFIQRFKNPVNRSSLYAFAANQFLRRNISTEKVDALLDSAYAEIGRIENLATGQPNRSLITYALALQNDEEKLKEGYRVIKNLQQKSLPIQLICRSLGYRNELYKATQNIPAEVSDDDTAILLRNILQGYRYDEMKPEWKEYNVNYFWFILMPIPYVNESL
jgi:energy-coupling factor transporter ATP-binding protein EcfA2